LALSCTVKNSSAPDNIATADMLAKPGLYKRVGGSADERFLVVEGGSDTSSMALLLTNYAVVKMIPSAWAGYRFTRVVETITLGPIN
jgi:hypothetical protein